MKRDMRVLPPMLSAVRGLARLGHEVTVMGYYHSPAAQAAIGHPAVKVDQASTGQYPSALLGRTWATARCLLKLYRHLRAVPGYDWVWLSGSDYPLISLMRQCAGSRTPIIYHSHEYNAAGYRYCRMARWVIVPEENRGWMTYFNAGLGRRPFVLPNIPYDHPRVRDASVNCADIESLRVSGRRIVLYQGDPDLERRCLREIVQALAFTPESTCLAIMPARQDKLARQRIEEEAVRHGVGQRVFFLRTRTAPEHLHVVACADIGIGLYRATSLNQVYCAPNRLYEFCGFGIPVVLPDYPGMRRVEDVYGCVATCDPEDPTSIAAAIKRWIAPEACAKAADGARRFYEREADYLGMLRMFCGLLEADHAGGRS